MIRCYKYLIKIIKSDRISRPNFTIMNLSKFSKNSKLNERLFPKVIMFLNYVNRKLRHFLVNVSPNIISNNNTYLIPNGPRPHKTEFSTAILRRIK